MAILPTNDTKAKGKKGQFAAEYKPPAPTPNQYINAEPMLGIRRVMQLDNGARVATQLEVDRGVYSRAPVAPPEYSFGNIKKSTMMTGVAGYNQRELPIAESPDDMSQSDYIMAVAQEVNPKARTALKRETALGQQFFLNTQSPGTVADYPIASHQMADNMLANAKRLRDQRQGNPAKQTADVMMASYSGTRDDTA